MTQRIYELFEQALKEFKQEHEYATYIVPDPIKEKFAELIVQECMEQVEQAKNSPFVSLDDAKRMSHFVDVTTKKIRKHFEVEE